MADENAQAETTADVSEQTPAEDANVSEDVKNPAEGAGKESGGDLKVALSQEREKRHELEKQLSDPQFVYNRAIELGLTDEEANREAEKVTGNQPNSQIINRPPMNIGQQVQYHLELDKAKEKYPELAKNDILGTMVTSLMYKGRSPMKAADEVFALLNKQKEEARTEGANQEKVAISEKEKAQTVQSSSNVDPETAENDRLIKQSKSLNRIESEKAHIELIKRKLK